MCKQWAGIEPALQDGAWVDWQVNFAQIFASLEGFETMKELHLDWACLIILSRMTWRIDFVCVCVCVCERERESKCFYEGEEFESGWEHVHRWNTRSVDTSTKLLLDF